MTMTDKVHPTQGEASSNITSGAIKWAGGSDWIVPSTEDYLANIAGLSGTPLNAFTEMHSSSSFDLTIDTGEGFVGGRWCARDTQTTVTLASSTTNQTVYLGWKSSSANTVVIGLDSAFSSSDDGRRTELYECDTDGSGVISVTDLHSNQLKHPHAENSDALDGIDGSNYARTDQSESFGSSVSFGSTVSMGGNNINSGARIKSATNNSLVELNGGGNNEHLSLHTGETGSSAVQIWDRINSNFLFRAFEGGQIEFPNGDVHILSGGLETDRGWAVRSDWGRRIEVGSSFSSEAVDGDLLFEPQ